MTHPTGNSFLTPSREDPDLERAGRSFWLPPPPSPLTIEQADDDVIRFRGLAISYGEGLNGTVFNERTHLGWPWEPPDGEYLFAANPAGIMFDHGWDESLDNRILGAVEGTERTEEGVWVQGILDRRKEYLADPTVRELLTKEAFAEIREVIEAGAVGLSTGSVSRLMQFREERDDDGAVTWIRVMFPVVETSLTPTPNNPNTKVALESLSTNGLVERYLRRQHASESSAPEPPDPGADEAEAEQRQTDRERYQALLDAEADDQSRRADRERFRRL